MTLTSDGTPEGTPEVSPEDAAGVLSGGWRREAARVGASAQNLAVSAPDYSHLKVLASKLIGF